MKRTVGIGHQDFETIRKENYFYVDKTSFIREWWNRGDSVTLLTRPRRFGKTLNMSMVEKFFSIQYAGREDLFQGLKVWEDEEFRRIQGTYPVISISFANVKEKTYEATVQRICQAITELYHEHRFLLEEGRLLEEEEAYFRGISGSMPEIAATIALHRLSKFLHQYYGKKVIILLDKYDTPMQEAYVNGYWDELVSFTRSLFHATFKTNPYMERAMMNYINKVALATFSYFDTGSHPSGEEPERFYHGFVLGLMVELTDRYVLTSNRESGFGRYDVMLEPRRMEDHGILLEFKVQAEDEEKELSDTVEAALKQIEEKQYETMLVEKGVPRERIRKYGFAFRGKTVRIGGG